MMLPDILKQLHATRRDVLSLPAEKRIDAILEYPQPAALVHSFPQEDFYFLIHEIGVDDSMELLTLASEKQWEYIVDTEVWKKDRLDMVSLTEWFYLLIKADPHRVVRWCLNEKTELIELYMFKNMELIIREHDQDPSDFEDGFVTIDDVFYTRFRDNIANTDLAEKRDAFLSEFLRRLAEDDHVVYQNMLFEFCSVIPAESEEELWRLRNVRLAEKGFMPFHEAVEIYQPLSVNAFKTHVKRLTRPQYESFLPIPLYPANALKQDNLFSRALTQIDIDDMLHQIQSEFAALCNRLISADSKTIREKEELGSVVKKACGYLSIGLERLTHGKEAKNLSAALIQRYPLENIFKMGYGLALHLKWRAEKWRDKSWFEGQNLPLTFWGEQWLGTLGGLLVKKPLYFDNYETGILYREFQSLEDIAKTKDILEEIIAFDKMLSRMSIESDGISPSVLNYKNLILTMWSRHYLGLTEDVAAISLEDFRKFFKELWQGKDKPKKIRLAAKQAFLAWISDKSNTDSADITQKLGGCFERLFEEIESEYGQVSAGNLDARYISMFLVGGKQ